MPAVPGPAEKSVSPVDKWLRGMCPYPHWPAVLRCIWAHLVQTIAVGQLRCVHAMLTTERRESMEIIPRTVALKTALHQIKDNQMRP